MSGEQRLWPLIVRTERCRKTSVPGIFVIRFDIEEEQEYTHTHTQPHFTIISMYVAVFISSSAALGALSCGPWQKYEKAIGKMFGKYDWH